MSYLLILLHANIVQSELLRHTNSAQFANIQNTLTWSNLPLVTILSCLPILIHANTVQSELLRLTNSAQFAKIQNTLTWSNLQLANTVLSVNSTSRQYCTKRTFKTHQQCPICQDSEPLTWFNLSLANTVLFTIV